MPFMSDTAGNRMTAYIRQIEEADYDAIHFAGVDPDYRKSGIGRSLYHHFFDISRTHGRKMVRCVTSPVNTNSIAFHQRMGFQTEPSTEDVNNMPIHRNYDGPGEDRVLFFKRLLPV
jgi:ribosomal protein S18 acetylase RimI-like enzyme